MMARDKVKTLWENKVTFWLSKALVPLYKNALEKITWAQKLQNFKNSVILNAKPHEYIKLPLN